jgi:hypothetical protein
MSASLPKNPSDASYSKGLVELLAVVLTLIAIAVFGITRSKEQPKVVFAPPPISSPAPTPKPELPSEPEPVPSAPAPSPTPVLDRERVARAEDERDLARRSRLRAESRLNDAEARLGSAQLGAAAAVSAMKSYLGRVQDPTGRFARAKARGAFSAPQKDRLEKELAELEATPRPGRKRLVDKSPVARPSDGSEFHFELRRGRVAYIDIERLMDRVKSDVRLKTRLGSMGRLIKGEVGPVGDFSMRYELGFELSDPDDFLSRGRGSVGYVLRGWELAPTQEKRGESYETTRHPASSYARAVNRLNPARDMITIWVYPDSFNLYRQLRDELNSKGFLVAGRPLPDGVGIQGSPGGSKSAGQ